MRKRCEIALIVAMLPSLAKAADPTLEPPPVNAVPGRGNKDSTHIFQGIPGAIRAAYGIGESFSSDQGKTWSHGQPENDFARGGWRSQQARPWVLVSQATGQRVQATPAKGVLATEPAKLPATTPWDVQKLRETPKFEWLDDKGAVRSLLYEGEPYADKPTRVFAYYASPATLAGEAAKDKAFPAVVLVHGGGGTAFREWAELWAKRGYAAIAMDLAGHRPLEGKNAHQRENRTRLPDGGPDQGDPEKFGCVDKPAREQWPYHAIAAVMRAHSLIRSFPEVDDQRTAVTGISWGGYLTCIAAGVDDRFHAAVPVYGCGFLHENSAWLDRFAKMTPQQRERWITLWDPSRYLPAVSMPILFVNGTNDFAYPLDSYMKSFNSVRGAKQIRITVNMPHGHPPGWAPQEIGLFIDHHLLGKPGLATVGEPQVVDQHIRLNCRSPVQLVKAELHVTTDQGAINKRQWKTLAAELADGVVTTPAPPPEATAWFVTVADVRGAIVSSKVTLGPTE